MDYPLASGRRARGLIGRVSAQVAAAVVVVMPVAYVLLLFLMCVARAQVRKVDLFEGLLVCVGPLSVYLFVSFTVIEKARRA